MTISEYPFLEDIAPGIRELNPYIPGKPLSELERELGITHSIKLASNENPLGVSTKVTRAVSSALVDLARYPDGSGFELRHKLAEKHKLDASCITLGNGSNDVLDMVARVFLSAGSESLFSEYAFAVYALSSQAAGGRLVKAPAKCYGHDLDAMLQRLTPHTRVIWIANPNNPTGTWLTRQELYAFLQKIPTSTIVVIDEAYIEFVNEPDYPDASLWLGEFPNLIVTRTFSKAYGLAALRIGYSLSHPRIADLLNRVRQPFNVNSLAQIAALAALDDPQFIERTVAVNSVGMRQLSEGFDALELRYIPSVGNFITLDLTQDAANVDQALLRLGCITRPIGGYGLPNHLRVSIGLEEENERLLGALKEVLQA
ncbi:MAG: histidinol-phosphate transaminase [Candidatus Thiodiazotropha sp.]|jgi:histidinol-phosphate aminotransferase